MNSIENISQYRKTALEAFVSPPVHERRLSVLVMLYPTKLRTPAHCRTLLFNLTNAAVRLPSRPALCAALASAISPAATPV